MHRSMPTRPIMETGPATATRTTTPTLPAQPAQTTQAPQAQPKEQGATGRAATTKTTNIPRKATVATVKAKDTHTHTATTRAAIETGTRPTGKQPVKASVLTDKDPIIAPPVDLATSRTVKTAGAVCILHSRSPNADARPYGKN